MCVNVIVIARVSTMGRTRSEPSTIPTYGARRSTSSGERFPSILDFTAVAVNTVGGAESSSRWILPAILWSDSQTDFFWEARNAGFWSRPS